MTPTTRAWMLIPWAVRISVPDGVPGVYLLGDFEEHGKRFSPVYVGRSDIDVRGRLLVHEKMVDGRYFLVRICESAEEAFHRECFCWHALQDSGRLLNRYHPDSPSGLGLACPYCSVRLGRIR